MNTESEFVAHEPCNNCGSSDANSRYSDGHAYCFACQTYTPADGDNYTPRMNNERVQFLGSAEQLKSEESSKQPTPSTESTDMVTPYVSHIIHDDGQVVGFKIKTKSKDFHYEGESTGTLFGQHLFPTSWQTNCYH